MLCSLPYIAKSYDPSINNDNRVLKAVAVFSLFLFFAMVLTACGGQAGKAPSSSISPPPGVQAGSQSASAKSSDAQSASAQSSSANSAAAQPVSLDFNNASDRALVNRELSWMSLAFQCQEGDLNVYDADVQVNYAVDYLALTNPAVREDGDFTSIAGPGAGANGVTNERIPVKAIDQVVQGRFGLKPDYSTLGDSGYKKIDDYIYFGVTAPFGQTMAYTAATSIKPLGDGRFTVAFETYSDYQNPFLERDDAFYGQAADQMMTALGASKPLRTGSATVRPVRESGNTRLVVESYSLAVPVDPPIKVTTPYYTVEIPAGWPEGHVGEVTYTVDEELQWASGGGNLGLGCHTGFNVDGQSIEVYCFTDNWGPQGDFAVVSLGQPSNLPGWHVFVSTSNRNPDGSPSPDYYRTRLNELASFVKLS